MQSNPIVAHCWVYMVKKENKVVVSYSSFEGTVDAINNATTIEELLVSLTLNLPVVSACYHHFASVGSFDFKGLSQYHAYNIPKPMLEYLDTYSPNNYDPGAQAAFSKGQFIWLSTMETDPLVVESGHNTRIKETISLIGDGLCFPLYGPNSRYGFLTMTFGLDKAECESIFGHQVQALAQKLHVRYCLMIEQLHKQVKLTPREAQVLELITFGKTNTDIGELLDISSNTVAGYVKQIFLKLEVSDRVSAAMRAQTIKIII